MYVRTAALLAGALLAAALIACGGDAVDRTSSATPALILGAAPPSAAPATVAPRRRTSTAVPAAAATPTPTPRPTRGPMFVSLDWLGGDVTVPDLPASFAPEVPDPALLARIQQAMSGFAGTYSVVVRNLADGRSASINEDHVYYAASLFKMADLREVFRERDSGAVDFSKVVTLGDKEAENDLGTLDYLKLQAGDTLKLGDAVKAMIIVSDTPCALLVQHAVGGGNVDAGLRSLGINQMTVNDPALPTTAWEMARLLTSIAGAQGVSTQSRHDMLSLMRQEWYGSGIEAGVAAGTAIAHKSGSYASATHDVGLVWGPAGPYIIAVLTDGNYDWKPVQNVSRTVWDYFATNR